MNKIITLFLDYRDYFYVSTKHKDATMDVVLIKKYFKDNSYDFFLKKYSDIDFRKESYGGQYILYQSTEDRNLFYKSYIEDLLIGLEIQGAILIPHFKYFRAHHNKVFMEILRDLSTNSKIKNIQSLYYGSFEEFNAKRSNLNLPVIVKPSEGSTSHGVKLAKTKNNLIKAVSKVSKSYNMIDATKNYIKSIIRPYHKKTSNYRHKFIIQNYIPNLNHDYKVLVYADKYFVLKRHNRKNDFRASGSGLFEWPEDVSPKLLDYANEIYRCFDVPYISLDIGWDGRNFYLFEFQFLSFGTLTLEKSDYYYIKNGNRWNIVKKKSILEEEFVNSIIYFLEKSK
jgi:hypothetical protein